ncbi:hypothetical protein [Nonomuraea guangzhouensis]|uniref:Twin-arginine translocation signal domain-containing protein n=1 Tax=Nonomuraea guangzhouensis TaxID=1291555 RepID=A0ABW4GFB4_9ACTN|nr:hypothetical protein [Nonomuraea guangzhouensis]
MNAMTRRGFLAAAACDGGGGAGAGLWLSIAAAKSKGAQVSLDDYAFPNWKPRADYLKPMYAKR